MNNNQILGIVLLVLGILLLLGWLHIAYLILILGVLLIVVGVMILMGSLRGAKWLGVVALVLGILLVLRDVPGVTWISNQVGDLLVTVIAVILIVLGIMKIIEK